MLEMPKRDFREQVDILMLASCHATRAMVLT